jgi:hypothetical protein
MIDLAERRTGVCVIWIKPDDYPDALKNGIRITLGTGQE